MIQFTLSSLDISAVIEPSIKISLIGCVSTQPPSPSSGSTIFSCSVYSSFGIQILQCVNTWIDCVAFVPACNVCSRGHFLWARIVYFWGGRILLWIHLLSTIAMWGNDEPGDPQLSQILLVSKPQCPWILNPEKTAYCVILNQLYHNLEHCLCDYTLRTGVRYSATPSAVPFTVLITFCMTIAANTRRYSSPRSHEKIFWHPISSTRTGLAVNVYNVTNAIYDCNCKPHISLVALTANDW